MSVATKVVLQAFNGKLTSQPIDWPREQIGQDIWLILDMENPSFDFKPNSSIKTYEVSTKRARFQFSGGYAASGSMPAIYKLVEVIS
jgi:hypothetical protein